MKLTDILQAPDTKRHKNRELKRALKQARQNKSNPKNKPNVSFETDGDGDMSKQALMPR